MVCCGKYKGLGDRERVDVPTGIHGAKMVCKHCSKFLSWAPSMKTILQMEERDAKIKKALDSENSFTDKQSQFLMDMIGKTKISPRQLNYINSLI